MEQGTNSQVNSSSDHLQLISTAYQLRRSQQDDSQPCYLQLASTIRELIISDQLQVGMRLPTVRELADGLSLSKGTTKHAYDVLASEMRITLRPGKGTYIQSPEEATPSYFSRKEKAIEQIDQLINNLMDLDFSAREIQLYVELKLREREESQPEVRCCVLMETPEERMFLLNILSEIPGVALFSATPNEKNRIQVTMDQADLLLTSSDSFLQMVSASPQERDCEIRLVGVETHPRTIVELTQIGGEERVGLLGLSQAFLSRMERALMGYNPISTKPLQHLVGSSTHKGFFNQIDTCLVPDVYFPLLSPTLYKEWKEYTRRGGKTIRYQMRIERASLLTTQLAIQTIKETKNRRLRLTEHPLDG